MAIDISTGYEYFMNSKHPLANKSGKVFVHRVVASEKLGRWLISEEHVHHIDGNKINNNPENIMILSASEHARLECILRGGKAREILFCKTCGKELYPTSNSITGLCTQCNGIASRKFNPSKEELEKLVSEKPLCDIAKYFGVSDSAIKKRCRRLNIKTHSQGFWIKDENAVNPMNRANWLRDHPELAPRGEDSPAHKITNNIVFQILDLFYNQKLPRKEIYKLFEIGPTQIRDIIRGESWTHIYNIFSELHKT